MIPSRLFLRALCVAAALGLLAPVASAGYKITKVTRAGVDNLEFLDINNAGLVAGTASNADYTARTGFVYNSHTGVYTDLTGPGGALSSVATGISDSGAVVGAYYASQTDPYASTAYIYEGGRYTDFNVPGAGSTTLRGISADGRYLTGAFDANGFVFDRLTGTVFDLGYLAIVHGINSNGVAAGSIFGTGRTPFLYDIASQVRTDYLPLTDRYRDVNDAGVVTGWGVRDGFASNVTIVGSPGGTSALKVGGSFGSIGYGINNDATVVGLYFRRDDANGAFIATTVPEPGTWALMLCGLLGLTAAATRRRERG